VRIGLITGEYPPDQGGVGDFTREMGQALVALGHRVHVITGKPQTPHTSPQPHGAIIHRVVEGWRWGCWREVLRMVRRERLEILNLQFQTAAYGMHPAINFVPRRQGRPPVVVTFHDLKVPYLFPKAGPLRWWVVQMLARRADGVIITNVEDEVRISSLKSPIPNLVRIPIGSNIAPRLPDSYDRDAWRTRWGVRPGDTLLGYFGFLNERKGGEDLIETLAALVARGMPAHLLLVGGRVGSSDPTNVAYAERVDRLIAERGLSERVHRTGFVSPEEVSANLAAVDVCVLPYRDGVSLRHGSLHACLAHGRPIVTTRPAVETPEFRNGENALLVAAEDIKALAGGVLRLMDDPALQSRLAAGAAELAAEFTWDRIAARTATFFERVIGAA
jgi:glycosyltransferase involved in cell wall biosynthesis